MNDFINESIFIVFNNYNSNNNKDIKNLRNFVEDFHLKINF